MQLQMLVAAAEETSLQLAAERVRRTQPAVTRALHNLEEELGTPLFDRSRRGDRLLTESGRLVYEYAKRILDLREAAMSAVAEAHSLRRGCVRVGSNESTNLSFLPSIILAFREQYPVIRIEVLRQPPGRLPRELADGGLDIAIVSFLPPARDLEATPILRDDLVLVLSPRHGLARRKTVTIRELSREPIIAPRRASHSRKALAEAFRRAEAPLNVVIDNCSFEATKRLAAVGAGVGFVPRTCAQAELARGELAAVVVEGFVGERTLWAVRRRTDAHSPAALAFFRELEEGSRV